MTNDQKKSSSIWGGRFSEAPAEVALEYSQSVDVDQRLAHDDIRGSLAHAEMLAKQGIISQEDFEAISAGLRKIKSAIDAGDFEWDPQKEDVHMNIESALVDDIGQAGARLHTGRSRNDQVSTDMRLWTRQALDETCALLREMIRTLHQRASETLHVLMPGYTHLQRAQPVRLAHHLLAWTEMLRRDVGRLEDARRRLNESPLGCAALASTTFPLDREFVADKLGFDRPMRNSLDASADRDFLVESLGALSCLAVHLSRISEELVLWSTQEFGFVTMSDAFTTGSSIMPQKKNPDMAELARGKTGRVIGNLVNLLVTLKGLPLAYNRDMQEDKAPAFEAFDTVTSTLIVLTGAIDTATFHADVMANALERGFLNATEVADFLAERGVPFRDAHHVSGNLVALAASRGCTLSQLDLSDFQNAHSTFDESVYDALDMETAVERRKLLGGPAKARVEEALDELSDWLDASERTP